MFSVNDKMAAVCGRYAAHIQPISFSPMVELGPLDLANNLPPGSKADHNKLSLICLDMSPDSRFLVAGDSGKNVFLFEFTPHTWDHLTSWAMSSRIAKLQFDRTGEHILITDKLGDIYLTHIRLVSQSGEVGPGQVTISTPRKILSHTHHVLDVVISQDNRKILTCSSDEMIRLWSYPAMTKLVDLDFKVDHKEAIVSSALVNRDQNLISISADGTLKYWRVWIDLLDMYQDGSGGSYILEDSSNPKGRSHKGLKSWNIFTVLDTHRGQVNEVVRVASTTFEGRVYIAVQISGYKELPVFELRPIEVTLRLFGQTRLNHDYVDFSWRGKHLFVFCPEEATMCKYGVSSHGGLVKEECHLRFNSSVKKDIASYGTYNRPFFPAKKRVNPQVVETVAQTRDILMKQFGPLPTEQENEAKAVLAKEHQLLLAGMRESAEARHAHRMQLAQTFMKKMEERSKKKKVVTILMPDIDGNMSSLTTTDGRLVHLDDQHDHREDFDYGEIEYVNTDDVQKLDEASATQETASIQTEEDGLDLLAEGDLYLDDENPDDDYY